MSLAKPKTEVLGQKKAQAVNLGFGFYFLFARIIRQSK